MNIIKFYRIKEPYGCFSNFSRHAFELDSYLWQTSEHYFQAQKYVGNQRYFDIMNAPTPRIAADLGRDRSIPLRAGWDKIKDGVMEQAVYKKFLTHDDIRGILLDTGDSIIIEDSPIDYYWGCGKDGTGNNMLGKILMKVRGYLRR